MKIDVPLEIPEGVDFPEYKNKEQLRRWIWRHIQIPQMMYLITTVDENGVPNCEVNTWGLPFGFAPNQMFAFACGRPHHTAQNVLQNGEFVVNIPSAAIGELAERTATSYPRGIDEITASGLTPIPSKVVKPPRIKECKVHFECRLEWYKEISEQHGGILFCGRIVAASGDQDILTGDIEAKMAKMRPIFVMPWNIDTEKMKLTGEEGTIAMPTHSSNLEKVELSPEEKAAGISWLFKILPCDPKETPCTTGIIPETFRRRRDVIRSLHPDQSIAAIGPKAKEITSAGDGRSLAGWKVLFELDGYILLLGVGLEVCTAMHLAESMVQFPKHMLEKITPPKWFVEKYPQNEWEWDVGPYPDFAKMEPICKEHGIMKTTTIGKATVKLLRLRELIDLYVEALRSNPDMFYGEASYG